ncbi:MAG: peptidylprolyl isomerase, partial [Acidimicrobiia bacterium]|nr:peptidylprolyl isomerase [Acidimicrobiia bacterium]
DYGLPHNYSIFGQVTEGLDVVDAIANTPTGAQDRPHEDCVIQSVTVVEA